MTFLKQRIKTSPASLPSPVVRYAPEPPFGKRGWKMRRNGGLPNDIHSIGIRLGIQNLSKYFQGRSAGGANGEIPAAGSPFDKQSDYWAQLGGSCSIRQNG
jgi:hypothetical protein